MKMSIKAITLRKNLKQGLFLCKEGKVAVYKLNEITKTLDKLFKYNVKTTEKVANLKW